RREKRERERVSPLFLSWHFGVMRYFSFLVFLALSPSLSLFSSLSSLLSFFPFSYFSKPSPPSLITLFFTFPPSLSTPERERADRSREREERERGVIRGSKRRKRKHKRPRYAPKVRVQEEGRTQILHN